IDGDGVHSGYRIGSTTSWRQATSSCPIAARAVGAMTGVSPVILVPFMERSVMMPEPAADPSFRYRTGINLLNRVYFRRTIVVIINAHTVDIHASLRVSADSLRSKGLRNDRSSHISSLSSTSRLRSSPHQKTVLLS